jgi:hypothetical protein
MIPKMLMVLMLFCHPGLEPGSSFSSPLCRKATGCRIKSGMTREEPAA